MSGSFRDVRVWQEAMKLTTEVYRTTAGFPKNEKYGLSQQIRRAAVSVPSNIAEGKGHRSDKEFVRFLLHARGSLLEVQTQLLIAAELQYSNAAESTRLLGLAETVGRALSGLINSMTEKAALKVAVVSGQRPTTNGQRHFLRCTTFYVRTP